MKTVFSNSMLAHVWAQQSQPFGRSGSMKFDGTVIYSYCTPIAAFAPGSTLGRRVVLVTSERYSKTTSSKHMPEVHRAIRGTTSYVVPDVGHSGGRAFSRCMWPASDPASWGSVHEGNLAYLVKEYARVVGVLMRANCWYGEVDAADIETRLRNEAESAGRYAIEFNLPLPVFDYAADALKIAQRRARLTAMRNAPRYAEDRAARVARERAVAIIRAESAIADWRAGLIGTNVLPCNVRTSADGSAMLRVRDGLVETSQGATVPIESARRAVDFIRRVSMAQSTGIVGEWNRNGESCPVGQFQIDRILPNGSIHAGCHFITWAEIERIVPLLRMCSDCGGCGVTDLPRDDSWSERDRVTCAACNGTALRACSLT